MKVVETDNAVEGQVQLLIVIYIPVLVDLQILLIVRVTLVLSVNESHRPVLSSSPSKMDETAEVRSSVTSLELHLVKQ